MKNKNIEIIINDENEQIMKYDSKDGQNMISIKENFIIKNMKLEQKDRKYSKTKYTEEMKIN